MFAPNMALFADSNRISRPAPWRVFCCQRAGEPLDKWDGMVIEENYEF